jgi:hypothetical protein
MVQRYIEGGYGASEMEEDEHGDWVSYEDYAKLKEMYDALSEKWLEVNGQHGALCDACISYGLEPTDMIENELTK